MVASPLPTTLSQRHHNPLHKDCAHMTKSVDNKWWSSSLLRGLGYCLLVLALFDIIDILVPPRFMNPTWEFQVIGSLVERVPVPLLGLGLVFYGAADFQSKRERLPLKFLSWASLLVGVLFLLLIPLLAVDRSRIDDQNNYQIGIQFNQQLSQLQQIENQVRNGTAKDLNAALTQLDQGRPLDTKNSQEVKSRLLLKITTARKSLQSQAEAARADGHLALLKKSVKWLLGALVSGVAFIYIWQVTRWARRGSRHSR